MSNEEQILKLENELKAVLEAYSILEEYACLLVGNSCDENETITHANSIIKKALNN